RHVALKFLPEELAEDPESLERFGREARSASALNHPNICTIYEINEANGRAFIAMELVEGKTLRDLLASGLMPMGKAIEIAAQVAEGLTKAHEAGIAHRDLKPENLMVSDDGFVKILAFQRSTAAETLVAILREPPEPITRQNRDAPAPLCWAIERCLAKAPDKRYVSTRDLARELATIRDRFSERPVQQVETRPTNLP